jgi:hypothetical protein
LAIDFTKFKIILFEQVQTINKELKHFLPKIYESGIRDPRSGKNLSQIPDPDSGVKKALDPGSATKLVG